MVRTPGIGCVLCRRASRPSAGGQLEQPSLVNSSTITGIRRSCAPTIHAPNIPNNRRNRIQPVLPLFYTELAFHYKVLDNTEPLCHDNDVFRRIAALIFIFVCTSIAW